MWRLWTRGWGFRSWLYWVWEATPRQIAFLLPKRVALWAFIRVYVAAVNSPSPEYRSAHDHWVGLHNLKVVPNWLTLNWRTLLHWH